MRYQVRSKGVQDIGRFGSEKEAAGVQTAEPAADRTKSGEEGAKSEVVLYRSMKRNGRSGSHPLKHGRRRKASKRM